MRTAVERYEQIVEIIHRYRSALPEGDVGDPTYYRMIMTEVFQIVKDDEHTLLERDLNEVDRDTYKLNLKYAEWWHEIKPEYEKAKEMDAVSAGG